LDAFVPVETVPLPRPLHRFGSAFPLALADTYAAAYTEERGVVLDPLAYPFSAADAVQRRDRAGIARSTSAIGAWARAVIAAAPTPAEVTVALEAVGDSTLGGPAHRVTMRDLYSSHCGTCRGPVVVEAFLWERDAPAPTKKAFRCTICAREGRALLIEPTADEDEARARRVEGDGLAFWQFVERFGPGEERRVLAQSIAALYTPRNLAAFMGSLRAIETALPDGPVKAFLRLCLLEVLVSGSRLNAVAGHGAPLRIEKGRARRGQAAQSREVNVWLEFERTARELAAWLAANPPARSTPALKAPADLVLVQAPADDPLGGWAYVASVVLAGQQDDPSPDGDGRLAGRERLLRTLRSALLDAHRGSKDGAPCVIYLAHAEAATIAACALAGAGAGYGLRGIIYQKDALPTAAGGTTGAVAVLDFDRAVPLLKDQRAADSLTLEETMRDGVRNAIIARGEPIGGDRAAVAALNALAAKGLLAPLALARAGGVSELELFLDHFRSALGDGRRSGIERLDGSDKDDPLFALIQGADDHSPLDDRVEWGVWGVLSAARDVDTRSLLKRAYGLFRGIETPDRELVERCIAAYGVQGDDGRWRLRDEDSLARRQLEQTLLAATLIDAGHRIGFKVQIGRELRRRPLGAGYVGKANVLADLLSDQEKTTPLARTGALRGPADVLDAVDLAWYDRGKMVFLWQLDWTARLHRSLMAIGEQIPDDDRVFRFIALADERRPLAAFKLERSAALRQAVRRRGWRFVKWAPLRAFALDPEAGLDGLEPVLGLEPAVEQAGQQLAFKW
ncbi:MAG TPA: hypothetical protein VGA38_09560, partial [Candidatus Limnocylindria bacterium]